MESNNKTDIKPDIEPNTRFKGKRHHSGFPKKSVLCFVVIFTFLFVIDALSLKFKIYDALSQKYGAPDVKSVFNTSALISQNLLMIVASVLTIFFAAYFVVVQVFKNRYPLDFIDKYVKKYLLIVGAHFICNICFGSTLIIVNVDLFLTKFFYIIHVAFCLFLFVKTYSDYQIFNPAKIVNRYKDILLRDIDDNTLNETETISTLNELKEYSEESFAKSELSISKYILDIYKELIMYFIKNRDKLSIDNPKNSKDTIKNIEGLLLHAIVDQMKLSTNYSYINYFEETLLVTEEIILKCIDFDKVNTFICFSKNIRALFRYCVQRENFIVCNSIISTYGDLPKYLAENKIRKEWLSIVQDELEYYQISSFIHTDSRILKVVYRGYFIFLEYSLKLGDDTAYNKMLDYIIALTYNNVKEADYGLLNFLFVLLTQHAELLIEIKRKDLIEDYINQIYDICEFGFSSSNKELCANAMLTYNYIYDKCQMADICNIINDNKFKLTLKSIYFYEDLVSLFMPKYFEAISPNSLTIDSDIEKVISEYKQILSVTFLRKNYSLALFFLNKVDELVSIFNKEGKIHQIKFLDLYENLMKYCMGIKASESFHIVLEHFTDLIVKLDKDEKISEDLGKRIVKLYEGVGRHCIKDKQTDLAHSLNGKIYFLLDKLYIVYKKKDLYYEFVQGLFSIGLDAVENNIEDVVKNVSNFLGWIAHKAIENKDSEILKEVVDCAVRLYNICCDFDVTEKTIIFVGTLFIILGAFTCSINDVVYTSFIIKAIEKIKKKDILLKSKIVREYQSGQWNEFMNNKARQYMNEFYNKIATAT